MPRQTFFGNAIIRGFDRQADIDMIVLASGSGENLHIFDRPALAEAALTVGTYFATATGPEQEECIGCSKKIEF